MMGILHRVYGLKLSPNFAVRLAADKNFHLRLTIEKMHTFVVLNDEYLRRYGCSDTNFTAMGKCTNPKTEIIEIQIIGIQIDFVIKQVFLLCY